MDKLNLDSYASLSQLAKLARVDKRDLTPVLQSAGIGFEQVGNAHYYQINRGFPAICDWLKGREDGLNAMESKLVEDREFTRLKRLHMAGDLISREDAERVASVCAAVTSNVIDSWGLDRARRNDLMERLAEAMRRAWSGDFEDEEAEPDD